MEGHQFRGSDPVKPPSHARDCCGSKRAMHASATLIKYATPTANQSRTESGRASFSGSYLSCRDSGKSDYPTYNNATAPGCYSSPLHKTESACVQWSYSYFLSAKAMPQRVSPHHYSTLKIIMDLHFASKSQGFLLKCPFYLAEIPNLLMQLIWKSQTQKLLCCYKPIFL